jgi:hypothetical protein
VLGLSDLNNELVVVITRKMKFLPIYLTALFGYLVLALEGKFPALSKRRGISAAVAVLAVLLVIALGVLIGYAILTTPGTSTTTYP